MPPVYRRLFLLLLLLCIFALLVGDTAAGLACGLAGSLALAASAILGALTQVASLDGLDMFHDGPPFFKDSIRIITRQAVDVNRT